MNKPLKLNLRPRKIPIITTSKYDFFKECHRNKIYWNNVVSQLEHKVLSPDGVNFIEELSRELPQSSFRNVCFTLKYKPKEQKIFTEEKETSAEPSLENIEEQAYTRKISKEVFFSKRKSLKVERNAESDTEVEVSPRRSKESGNEDEGESKTANCYYDFLRKPEREAVTWASRYLQPEREDEKSLERRANELTDKIATEFADYMKQLGGDQTSQLFTTGAIKELFDVEFNKHAAHSLKVVPKELPSVINNIANITKNIERSQSATLVREIKKDIIAERKQPKLEGFGSYLPEEDRWLPPNNDTEKVWCTSSNVPTEIVSLKAVWEGITNLKSVKEYCHWMIEHPEYRRPPYLSSLGLFDPAILDARFTMDSHARISHKSNTYDLQEPIIQMRKRLSTLTSVDID